MSPQPPSKKETESMKVFTTFMDSRPSVGKRLDNAWYCLEYPERMHALLSDIPEKLNEVERLQLNELLKSAVTLNCFDEETRMFRPRWTRLRSRVVRGILAPS